MKPNSLITFGGITLILSGILFLAQYLFLLPMPSPPLADADLMSWLREWKTNIAMADELLFFATLMLIPSIAALYRILVKVDLLKAIFGCGLLAVIIPVNMVLDIVLGRWVYPVYDIELSPDIYKLVVSFYYGGMHLVAIIFSAATIILCFAIRRSVIGKPVAYLGFGVGVLDLIGAFPWLIGTTITFVCQLFFCAWFVLLGLKMIRIEQG